MAKKTSPSRVSASKSASLQIPAGVSQDITDKSKPFLRLTLEHLDTVLALIFVERLVGNREKLVTPEGDTTQLGTLVADGDSGHQLQVCMMAGGLLVLSRSQRTEQVCHTEKGNG